MPTVTPQRWPLGPSSKRRPGPAPLAPHAQGRPAHPLGTRNTLQLPAVDAAACPVHTVACAAGEALQLQVLEGRVWLTCEGQPDDHFLDPGAQWSSQGPARVHLSAENGRSARVAVALHPGG